MHGRESAWVMQAVQERLYRIAALAAWPGVAEATSYGTPSLTVGGKFMARLKDADTLVVRCPLGEKSFLMEAAPAVFFETPHYSGYPAVLVRLSAADDETLRGRLEVAWRMQATKRLIAAYDAPRLSSKG